MRRGYDLDGKADGVIGTKTKQAISDFQAKAGLAAATAAPASRCSPPRGSEGGERFLKGWGLFLSLHWLGLRRVGQAEDLTTGGCDAVESASKFGRTDETNNLDPLGHIRR